MTVHPLPQSPIILDRQPLSILSLYDNREMAYVAALRAVRASRYELSVRVRFLSLLNDRLAASRSAEDVARETVTYARVATWFARRAT